MKPLQQGKKYSVKEVHEYVYESVDHYKEANGRQARRIGRFVEFLLEKGMLDDFNAWEESKRAATDGEDQAQRKENQGS